jgi:hypothetical protein
VQIYKDGGTTQRASASGITATTDFDALTGINLVIIDLSDNTTADFYAAGSEYLVVIADVTIDGQTVRFPIARFTIGFTDAILDTTLATLASQTVFTLTNGPADNNALVGCEVYIQAAASSVQCCMGVVSAYVGSTKTVTLSFDPAIYTIAAKDNISVMARKNAYAHGGAVQTSRDLGLALPAAAPNAAGGLLITAAGSLDMDDIGADVDAIETATAASAIRTAVGLATGNLDAQFAANATLANQTTLLSRLSAARAGYLDNLNVGGAVAAQADVLAINTSSSKHIILTTVGQYERPESGNTVYTVEARTFTASTGAAVNADSTPTLTGAGQTSGSLAANIGAATNPATGVYRWTYTVASNATSEPIRFDVSAVISSATFTLSTYTQVVDEVSQTWSSTDASKLTSIFNKLPTNNIGDQTLLAAAITALPSDGSIATDVQTGLTAQGYTTARATKVDNLDATVASRLPTGSYVAPDNASAQSSAASAASADSKATTIVSKTNLIPAVPAAVGSTMLIDQSALLPLSPVAGSIGQAFAAVRSSLVGHSILNLPVSNPGTGSEVFYAHDGTTVLATVAFTTDASGNITVHG